MGANKKTLKQYHDALDVLKSISEMYDQVVETKISTYDPNWIGKYIKIDYIKGLDIEKYKNEIFRRSATCFVVVDYNIESGSIYMYIEAITASHFPIKIHIDSKSFGNFTMVDNVLSGLRCFLKKEVDRMLDQKMVELEDQKNAVAS